MIKYKLGKKLDKGNYFMKYEHIETYHDNVHFSTLSFLEGEVVYRYDDKNNLIREKFIKIK